MSIRRRLAIFGSLALAISIAALSVRGRAPSWIGGGAASRAAPADGKRGVAWPRGMHATYTFQWSGETHAYLGGLPEGRASLDGNVEVAGELEVKVLGERDGRAVLAARATRLDRHVFTVIDKDMLADDASARALFDGREAYAEVEPSGRVASVLFRRDDPPAFKAVMHALLPMLGATVEGGQAWTAHEPGPSGKAIAEYVAEGDGARTLTRTRTSYESLTALPAGDCEGCTRALGSRGVIGLDELGRLASVTDDESLAVKRAARAAGGDRVLETKSRFALHRETLGTFEAATHLELDMARLEARACGELAISADGGRRALDAQAARTSLDAIQSDVRKYAALGARAIPDGWLGNATAFLTVHPESCRALAFDFEAKDLGTAGRMLLLDLLAATGSPEAQSAMRDALASDAAHGDAHAYLGMVQRLGLVAKPDGESIAFLENARTEAARAKNTDVRAAALHALGAAADNAAHAGDLATAQRVDAELRSELRAARGKEQVMAALGALGNAGRADDLADVQAQARAEDPSVRGAAAWALRKVDAPEARATLLTMAEDEDAEVRASALRALATQPLAADDFARLAARVEEGPAGAGSDRALVDLALSGGESSPERARLLQAVLARVKDDPGANRLQAQIKWELDRMRSGG